MYSLQLYSVRDTMPQDFAGTLARVAALGYTGVEFAGFFGHDADTVLGLLRQNGLAVTGAHDSLDPLLQNFDAAAAFHTRIGNPAWIVPCADLTSQEKIDRFIEDANRLAPRLAERGITLGYHNHASEFERNPDGSVPFEQLLYRTELAMEVDIYWAYVGMGDPIALIDRLGDRLRWLHMKDGFAAGGDKPLGLGDTPVRAVYEKMIGTGIPMVVESETCTPDGMTEAKICIEYLRSLETGEKL